MPQVFSGTEPEATRFHANQAGTIYDQSSEGSSLVAKKPQKNL